MSVDGEFKRLMADDRLCADVLKAVRDGDAAALRRLGFGGFAQYAGRLSELMTVSVRGGLDFSEDFGELMRQVNSPARYAHHLVNECGTAVQTALDERQGVHLRAVQLPYNDGRTKGLIGDALSRETPEQGKEALATGLGTAVKDAGNEFMKQNAEQRSRAGFTVTVERTGGANCCPWCADRVGKWELKNAPKDVFGVHDNCTCMVDYTNSKGTVRGRAVTHKIDGKTVTKWEFADKIPYTPPRVLTKEEAAARGGFDKPKRLTGGANGGIIKAEGYAEDNFDRKLTLSTIAEDLRAVNPKYKRGTPYGDNCQRCVPTYYLRRKGYKVEALPTGINPQIDSQLYIQPHILWERGGTPVVPIQTIGSKYFGKPEIIEAMRELPDGAMFEVFCKWKNRSGGHVFIAEKIDGKTHFIDPQIGDMDVSRYFSDMKLNQTTFWRIDNARLREDMIPYCCKTVRGDDDDTK